MHFFFYLHLFFTVVAFSLVPVSQKQLVNVKNLVKCTIFVQSLQSMISVICQGGLYLTRKRIIEHEKALALHKYDENHLMFHNAIFVLKFSS